MINKSYFIHNSLWALLSPVGIVINLLMYESNMSFLKLLPEMNASISMGADVLVSTLFLSVVFWLLVNYAFKSLKSTFKYGVIYFFLFNFILIGFVLSDAVIFTKDMVEGFLNNIGCFSVDSNLEVFEKQKRVRDFILASGFLLLDTLISSGVVFLIRINNFPPLFNVLSKRK